MAKILIKHGRVWDGESFFFADVLTDGERISKIAPAITDSADYVYDATGKTVSAGLVDIHVHMRGISCDAFGIDAAISCFPFGVTAALDAGGGKGDKALLDSFCLKTAVFVGVDIKANRPDIKRAEAMLLAYGDRALGVKVYFDTMVSEVTDVSPLRTICDFAHSRGLRVMVHCSHSPIPMNELLRVLSRGDVLTHAFHGGESNAASDGFQGILEAQRRGVVIDTGFAGHVHTDFQLFKDAIKAGVVPDTVSTDITRLSAYRRGGRYGMTMCMSMARKVGLPEKDIFKAVTSTPAKVLGKTDEWGSLTVGGAADIAVLDYTDEGFSLTDSAKNKIEDSQGYRCVLTVIDGQLVYRD